MSERLLDFLSAGAQAILATLGEDGWPKRGDDLGRAARDADTVRFGADIGSAALDNLIRGCLRRCHDGTDRPRSTFARPRDSRRWRLQPP